MQIPTYKLWLIEEEKRYTTRLTASNKLAVLWLIEEEKRYTTPFGAYNCDFQLWLIEEEKRYTTCEGKLADAHGCGLLKKRTNMQ